MSRSLYVDTCSLIGIFYSGMASEVFGSLNIHISPGVVRELEEISEFEDEDAEMATRILNCKEQMIIEEVDSMVEAEDELIDLCRKNPGIIVTDDLKTLKGLEGDIISLYSVHLIYILLKKERISKNEAILAFHKMREKRDWKNNLISTMAEALLLDD